MLHHLGEPLFIHWFPVNGLSLSVTVCAAAAVDTGVPIFFKTRLSVLLFIQRVDKPDQITRPDYHKPTLTPRPCPSNFEFTIAWPAHPCVVPSLRSSYTGCAMNAEMPLSGPAGAVVHPPPPRCPIASLLQPALL